ncbi:MAG TPA: tRNA threonylcarbamoyladenosine biosynthesis protein RimN [Thiotrichaceae bacterium]|jgi:L-threonylcarbamoyladenylate synthase|nr:tRNA threonylcarbamoyladenosine biosynthesis protein RimN [Thiotrichaceae bacterium]HIM07674.1 tRNA threonylcarbamoyladenosine biosynthesis protein RimN [Gammaproteobacteria bacterium]
MNSLHLKEAVRICEEGGVIAYPTEAVFGLGCLPLNEHSVQRILKLKQRSVDKGLILVAASIEQLNTFVDFSKVKDMQAIRDSWPGPVTWLIPAKQSTPYWLTGGHKTLAVRVSSCPTVQSLCEKLGPIVSTSANPKLATPAKSSVQVDSYFKTGLDYVIPAHITNTYKPTEIRDAQTGDIFRLS